MHFHSILAIIPMTDWEALSKFFDSGMTVENYTRNYKESKARNAAIWPEYTHLKRLKDQILPDGITVINEEAICPMQSYLDSQSHWLLDNPFLLETVKKFQRIPGAKVVLVSKVGADGSGNQSVNRYGTHPGSLFATSIAPVELQVVKGEEKEILWTNPRANSSVGHAYLRLKFEKELKGIYNLIPNWSDQRTF